MCLSTVANSGTVEFRSNPIRQAAMHQTQDIYSLTDFKQNAKEHLERLHATGRPEILTVNGKAEAVVMAPEAYDRLLQMSMAEVKAKIGAGLEQARLGQLIDGGTALLARRARRAVVPQLPRS